MQDYGQQWMPCMQQMGVSPQMYSMGMPQMQMYNMGISPQMYPMTTMSDQQLERMYPRSYHIIYPEVIRCCDMMEMTHGSSHVPTREELEKTIDEITAKIEGEVTLTFERDAKETSDRQLGSSGRRVLRDLVGILLIRELLRRRRRPFYGFPYYGGFGSGGYGGGFY